VLYQILWAPDEHMTPFCTGPTRISCDCLGSRPSPKGNDMNFKDQLLMLPHSLTVSPATGYDAGPCVDCIRDGKVYGRLRDDAVDERRFLSTFALI
jgi:hypothetical protein